MTVRRGPFLWISLLVIAVVGWYAWKRLVATPAAKPVVPHSVQKPRPLSSPVEGAPQLAIVVDDVAYNTKSMDHFAALGVPLTFAILPRHRLSKILADKARSHQFDVILHLPLEPHDMTNFNPGPSGLLLTMSDQELKKQFDKAVDSVPGLLGINNHMGSAFTENEPKMKLLLHWTKERGLFFLDSYTSPKSVVVRSAKKVGVPCLRNETFLDNEDTVEGIERQLDHAVESAKKHKRSIAIGHYRRKYLVEALSRKLPEFKKQGIEFVTLSTFYKQ